MIKSELHNFFRSLRRDFAHWGLAILIMGIAVGTTATVYSLTDKLVLHPLPIPNLERVVILSGLTADYLPTTNPVVWWEHSHSLERLAAVRPGLVQVRAGNWRGSVRAEEVSDEFFAVFGVKVFRGRDFAPEDEVSGNNHVVILSYAFWTSQFDGRHLPLGSVVQVNRNPYIIVGIAPESIDGLGVDLWAPRPLDRTESLKLSPDPNLVTHYLWVGRLRKGVTILQAHKELLDLLNRLNTYYTPQSHVAYGDVIGVGSFERSFGHAYEPALSALFAGSILILLIAGTDCSGFLIGRAVGRAKEVAIRRVFGASRLDILRQALVEASGMGLMGGIVGVLVARGILFVCQSAFPVYFVRLRDRLLIDPRVFLMCLALGTFVGILAGWLPGKRMAAEHITRVLKEDFGPLLSPRGKWIRVTLVILQVAFTFVLVMGATLTLETARNLFGKDKGYSLANVVAMHLSIPGSHAPKNVKSMTKQDGAQSLKPPRHQQNYASSAPASSSQAETGAEQAIRAKATAILNAISALPVVSKEAFTNQLPIDSPGGGYYVGGWGSNNFFMYKASVSPEYFSVLGMRFLAGRSFSVLPAHEIVIEESVASALWSGENPLGRTMVLKGGGEDDARVVVGVVNDTRSLEISGNPPGQFYLPLEDPENVIGDELSAYLVLRCRSRCGDITPELLAALNKVGADSYVDRIAPLAEFGRSVTEPLWIRTSLLSFYALVGLALALSGVFVLSSYLSVIRRQEMGIRMALGSGRAELIFQITREGTIATLIGLGLGTILWFSAGQILRSLLYGVTSLDPVTFVGVGLFIFLITLVGSTLPVFLTVIRQNPADLLRVV